MGEHRCGRRGRAGACPRRCSSAESCKAGAFAPARRAQSPQDDPDCGSKVVHHQRRSHVRVAVVAGAELAGSYQDAGDSCPLGAADVVVAVPEAWADVVTMADLDDVAAEFRQRHHRPLRIATKYWQLTQNWFADHGIALYRIVESLGATEGAPAAGTADIIVDITSTGSTLKANQLKILKDGIILHSEANLIASKRIRLPKEDRLLLKEVCRRIAEAVAAE